MNLLPILSGEARGAGAGALRGGLRLVEPLYAGIMRLRNRLYDAGVLPARDLGRPTISVGNLTTGGTGKTPMVHWVAERLRRRGYCPAVLLRGYGRRSDPHAADEPTLLRQLLGPDIAVKANPDRLAGAAAVLGRDPTIDCFILDDGFQHRRARRNFDLLLISATQPFGYGHVLPRGLLREPIAGADRANAIVITHADQVSGDVLEQIRSRLPNRPTFFARHVLENLEELRGMPYATFSGIGDPETFGKQVSSQLGPPVADRRFADHHAYTQEDVAALLGMAQSAGARVLLTTRKDFVKLTTLTDGAQIPIRPIALRIEMTDDDGARLLQCLEQSLGGAPRADQAPDRAGPGLQ